MNRSFPLPTACVATLGMALIATLAAPARADFVAFDTGSSSFAAGTGATISAGGTVITFTDPASATRIATITFAARTTTIDTPAVVDLGTFTVDAGAIDGNRLAIPAGSTFTLRVTQTSPVPGTGSLASADINGLISMNSGFIGLTFSQTAFDIGEVDYSLVNLTNGNPFFGSNTLLLDTNASGGVTRLSAFVQTAASPVPEPRSLALLGVGCAAAFGWSRRRRLLAATACA